MKLIKKLILLCLLILPLLLTVSCNPFAEDDDDSYPLLTQGVVDNWVYFFDLTDAIDTEAHYAAADAMPDSINVPEGWEVVENNETYCKVTNNDGVVYTTYYVLDGDGRYILELNNYEVSTGITVNGTSEQNDNLMMCNHTLTGADISTISYNYTTSYDADNEIMLSASGTITIDGITYDVSNLPGFANALPEE